MCYWRVERVYLYWRVCCVIGVCVVLLIDMISDKVTCSVQRTEVPWRCDVAAGAGAKVVDVQHCCRPKD